MGRIEKQKCACDYCAYVYACTRTSVSPCRRFHPGTNWGNYLSCAHWKEVRIRKIIATGEKCELCGSKNRLHVHHLRYDRLFHEEPEDLQVLCVTCHAKVRMATYYPWLSERIKQEAAE